jgi:hypothetical protein
MSGGSSFTPAAPAAEHPDTRSALADIQRRLDATDAAIVSVTTTLQTLEDQSGGGPDAAGVASMASKQTMFMTALTDMKRRLDALQVEVADAVAACAGATRFFGKVQTSVIIYDRVPDNGVPRMEHAKAEARAGDWLMLMHPLKYVERRAEHGAVTDTWVCTASLNSHDGSVLPLWVRLKADGQAPVFTKLSWWPHD